MIPVERMLSPHFSLAELVASQSAQRNGLDNTPAPALGPNLLRLAQTLELVRQAVGRPVIVTSGFRSPAVNRLVGSADSSAHVLGLAADLIVPGMAVRAVCRAIVQAGVPFDQLIDEGGWTHIGLAAGVLRGQQLTALFAPGRPTRYAVGIAE
jgi:zinc D-Ala-D-Ala carboxypeptidase